ncbi:MAG TPA: NADH-quinone oxidoreductase subunit NuoK [Thermoleophilia bacterium]|jgi:NAD(P)H-quinone oxidoreductase subunit 4L|nr:NADH-quinone oxidoreductase subunit NuoK [Thermoleophilia bacterium]
MTLQALIVVAAAIFGIGVYGALSQQSFVMIMMGLELMLNGTILAGGTMWAMTTGGSPKGQMLVVVLLTVMAVEAAMGFALVIGIYRVRRADITEKLRRLKG